MDKEKAIERLMKKTNLSYDINKKALEEAEWDILDAILILEEKGEIPKPETTVYYTNRIYEEKADNEIIKVQYKKEEKKSFLEIICGLIDTFNNIFFKIVRNDQVLIKLPLTVVILLLFFTFWISVPLFIIGFFYDVEYSFVGRGAENKNINNFLRNVSREIQYRKNNRKGRRG